jgi:hypothetical protein
MTPYANLDCYTGQKYGAHRRAEKRLAVSKAVLKNKLGISRCAMEQLNWRWAQKAGEG